MKQKITLNNWRFELLKAPAGDWQQLRVGGHFVPENGSEQQLLTDTVIDLQAVNQKQQFKQGFVFETERYTVTLGKQEKLDVA